MTRKNRILGTVETGAVIWINRHLFQQSRHFIWGVSTQSRHTVTKQTSHISIQKQENQTWIMW